MRMSDGVEWAVHCATVLGALPEGACLSGARLAEFHGVPAPYLAKHLQTLTRAGVFVAVPGPRGGYRLARPAAELTVLDVVEALEGTKPAFRCTEIRKRGPSAVGASEYSTVCGIHRAMVRADGAWRDSLRSTTIAELLHGVLTEAPPTSLTKGIEWLQAATKGTAVSG
ncbi:MAG TPA: Rrf2 family transcriptional regulator [Acidimicrobiia bacterium]|jgi:Rrf2 family protein|nr:Rrf2 family transcriptional regulator [Acidimicrobiia bacterium]